MSVNKFTIKFWIHVFRTANCVNVHRFTQRHHTSSQITHKAPWVWLC